ncbi:MAG: hypothetical protein MJ231_05120 [bacterium]|nr:hypothetical protein [bacterium]
MINKINGVGFQGRYQRFVKPVQKETGVNVKRGLKAAGIYAASTMAVTLGLLACRGGKNNNEQIKIDASQPIENVVTPADTLSTSDVLPAKQLLRPLNEEGGLIVKEGDSYWKIATDLLIDKGVENPTDTQIWNEMSKLMNVNFRCFDEEVYGDDVPIKPGEYIYINEVPIDYD